MLVLTIDTATKIGSVALFHDEKGIMGEININAKTNHSAIITKMIEDIFALTGYEPKDIDRIAVALGPGSFTGIRIGIAVAKGLAYSLNKEIVGINELDLLANASEYRQGECIIPMIDARKERAYYSMYYYDNSKKLIRDMNYEVGEIKTFVEKLAQMEMKFSFIGDGALNNKKIIKDILGERCNIFSVCNSISRGGIAGQMAVSLIPDNLYTLEPFYANKSQAERALEKKENDI